MVTGEDQSAPLPTTARTIGQPVDAPLSGRGICRSTDLNVFRDRLNALYYPARVDTRGRPARLEKSWLSGVRLSHLTLGFVRFGAETVVDPGPLGSYHVNVALAGRVESVCGSRHAIASPTQATVFTPEARTILPRWGRDATQLCIKIQRRSLETELAGLLGHPVGPVVDFDLAFDLSTPTAQSWLATLRLLLSELNQPGSLLQASAAHREHLERLVISGLLLAQPNAFTDELRSPQRPLRPRTVGRVLTLIEEHPERHYTLGDLASHAGVSARRLQQGFHDHVGMSPTEYLRHTRLKRAHRDLLEGDDPVADVALRWGFTHLSRFAKAYRDQFGELPSDTRRRSST